MFRLYVNIQFNQARLIKELKKCMNISPINPNNFVPQTSNIIVKVLCSTNYKAIVSKLFRNNLISVSMHILMPYR